jgi:gluconokinase
MTQPVAAQQAIVVVMGVTGCEKTTIGQLLAKRLGVAYAEADSVHPAATVDKMASGQALDDDDRYPWLAAISLSFYRHSTPVEHEDIEWSADLF